MACRSPRRSFGGVKNWPVSYVASIWAWKFTAKYVLPATCPATGRACVAMSARARSSGRRASIVVVFASFFTVYNDINAYRAVGIAQQIPPRWKFTLFSRRPNSGS
eukprot:CAMPEP_0177788724 /NCGR_PEP_ID=MMETSP0491_2-20121128/22301_1 /TAXON_ID=63592 /ORGANISM="Tetraselmis chuii, Strain PLY429" /LENGTH=105 /DNA_ID=CAMNT_0019310405 /DNA_START=193 /DNA_END=510 /DNA_ORIENTATION=-